MLAGTIRGSSQGRTRTLQRSLPQLLSSEWRQYGDDPIARMVKHHKLTVGDKTVVGLVGKRGTVVGITPELLGDVNCPVWNSAWVKNLVAVLVPGQPVWISLATPQLDPVVECKNCVWWNCATGEESIFSTWNPGLTNLNCSALVRI